MEYVSQTDLSSPGGFSHGVYRNTRKPIRTGSQITSQPGLTYVAEDDVELLVPLPYPPKF